MVIAFILINTRPGKEDSVLEELEKNSIKILDKAILYGEYDLIVKIEALNVEELRKIVIDKIRKVDGVEKTVTLIVAGK